MQGYVTSEPFAIETQGKFKPKIFLLADQGFNTYSTLIETRRDLVEKKPDLVQRFVDASTIGWYNYLYGDNKAAQRADQEAQSGNDRRADRLFDRQDEGIRHRRFRRRAEARHRRDDRCAHEGVSSTRWCAPAWSSADIDYRKAYTLQFVNKGVGTEPAAEDDIASVTPRRRHRLAARRRQDVRQRRRRARRLRPRHCATANSSRCSARPAAASRRRCASSPA